jgi:hypothetical protein
MPEISFFIDENDVRLLVERLNSEPEIAFIVPDGLPQKSQAQESHSTGFHFQAESLAPIGRVECSRPWKAVRRVDTLADGRHGLWHIPAGPLPQIEVNGPAGSMPLLDPDLLRYPPIADPWAGWIGTDQFGPGCLPWIRLELWTRHQPYTERERVTAHELISFWLETEDVLVVSGLQWTGSYFRPAPAQTQRWWNRMRRWVDQNAVRLRSKPSFWAFPSALQKLKGGMRYYSRNFDLDCGIQDAR